jgi:hypothetical protein
MSQEFTALVDKSGLFPVDITPPWFSMLIYHLGDEHLVAAAQRLSLTPST